MFCLSAVIIKTFRSFIEVRLVLFCVSVYSTSSAASFLHSSGERRSAAGRSGQLDLRRYRVADALRALATRCRGADAGGQPADRQEHPAVDGRARDGDLHVCRDVRSRQHRVRRRGARQRYGNTRYEPLSRFYSFRSASSSM